MRKRPVSAKLFGLAKDKRERLWGRAMRSVFVKLFGFAKENRDYGAARMMPARALGSVFVKLFGFAKDSRDYGAARMMPARALRSPRSSADRGAATAMGRQARLPASSISA
jgi:hypothetical protein